MEQLYHHGILGQGWGVRRGPPYPIEDKILRKGTKLNSISSYDNSSNYKQKGFWMYTYSPKDKWDSKVYRGPFSIYKINRGSKCVYEHRYEVISDLKMPTRKERVTEFINVYKNDKVNTISDLEKIQKSMKYYDVGSEKAQNVNLQNLRTMEDYKNAYEIFNHAMENVSSFKSTKAYAEIMSRKYDAMVDDNNQGIYNGVNDPIIIFRANEVLKEIGKARMVTLEEIRKNYNQVERVLDKKGESVKL